MNTQTHSFRLNTVNSYIVVFFFVLAIALISPIGAKADNLVQNGGFETGDFSDWQVTGNVQGAQVINSGGAHTGCCWAKVDSVDQYVYISQYINTPHTPNGGTLYDLLFWWEIVDKPPFDFQVFWDGKQIADVNQGAPQWTQLSFKGLSATQQETQLTFGFKVADGKSYFGLDDISVNGEVPEPGSLMLLGSGVVGLAGVMRCRLFR